MDRRCIKQFKQWLPKEHNNKVELVRVFTLFLPLKKNKNTFSNKNGYVWMKDQTEGKNLPLKTKTDTCGRKINPEGKISFWNKKGCVWTNDQSGRTNLPFQTKTGTFGRKIKLEGKISLFKPKRILVDRAEVVSIYEFIHHDPVYSMVQILLTFSTKFSRFPSFYHNRDFPFILFCFFFVKFWGFFEKHSITFQLLKCRFLID